MMRVVDVMSVGCGRGGTERGGDDRGMHLKAREATHRKEFGHKFLPTTGTCGTRKYFSNRLMYYFENYRETASELAEG